MLGLVWKCTNRYRLPHLYFRSVYYYDMRKRLPPCSMLLQLRIENSPFTSKSNLDGHQQIISSTIMVAVMGIILK